MDSYTQKGMPTGAEEVSASRMMDDERAPSAANGTANTVTITQQDGRFLVQVQGGAPQMFASLDEVAPVVMEAFGVELPAEGGSDQAMTMPAPRMGRA